MNTLVLAVPSKGRLQENAEAFFARAGLNLVKPRGARDYRGAVAGLPGIEVAYLSASDITAQLALGAVHLGVTGEDQVRDLIGADGRKGEQRPGQQGRGLAAAQAAPQPPRGERGSPVGQQPDE